MTEPEQWAVELAAKVIPAWWRDDGDYAEQYESHDAAMIIQRAFEERTGQLIPAPSVDDAMVERCAIFRQIGRWEMAQEIAFNLETPVKDCTPGAPEQAAFDKAAKLVSMSVGALAGREFCKLPVHVQFHDGEWAPIMDEATAAISAMQVKP